METSYQSPKPISPEVEQYLRSTLSHKNGALFWNSTGMRAEKSVKGYLRVWAMKRSLAAHHIVWLLCTGKWPTVQIDHINQEKQDNRFENLRLASNSMNMQNRGVQRNNMSGIKNVSWHRETQKWRADVKRNGKKHYLGVFATKEEAALAVQSFL